MHSARDWGLARVIHVVLGIWFLEVITIWGWSSVCIKKLMGSVTGNNGVLSRDNWGSVLDHGSRER